MWLGCSCRLATQEHMTFTASILNCGYCGIMPRANCVQQHHRDILTATNNLLKFVLPKFYNLFSWNKRRFVLINLVLAKYFSSFSYQISMTTNLNSPGEKRNTHRTMPLQLLPVLPKKKKIDGPSPNSTTPLYEPIAASQTGFETNLTLKKSTTEICSQSVLSSPKK